MAMTPVMQWNPWSDQIQILVSHFVQNDNELGEMLLDHMPNYWEACFDKGLTPQQAVDDCINNLSVTPGCLTRFRQYRGTK
jgi:hypothetical protein